MKPQIFQYRDKFNLEQGGSLPSLNVAYHTYGTLNSQADNVIWICHTLQEDSEVARWWPGMVGKGALLDPDKHFIVCANMIGSCYGSTGPMSTNPESGVPWYLSFPEITIRDQVAAFDLLRKHLVIKKIHTIIGASMGGFQALEYCIRHPSLFGLLVVVASSLRISPWAAAFNQSQRLAIEADPSFGEERPYGGINGLKAAGSIASLSYGNERTYGEKNREPDESKTAELKASTWQNEQGDLLVRQFDAYSYHVLSSVMDTHNVVRERGSLSGAMGRIRAGVLSVGISSDLLFPTHEQKLIAHLVQGEYREIESPLGHAAILQEADRLSCLIRDYWKKNGTPAPDDSRPLKNRTRNPITVHWN